MMRTIAALAAAVLLWAAGCGSQSAQNSDPGAAPAAPSAAAADAPAAPTAGASDDAWPLPASSGSTASSASAAAGAAASKKLTPQEHIARGIKFSELGRRREAIASYAAALKQDPNNLSALLYRAGEQYALHEFEAAEQDLAQALAADPSFAEAYILRAHLAGARHDYQAAVDDFHTALKHPERDANFAKYFGDVKDVVAHVYLAAAYAECPDLSFRDDAKAFQHALQACQLDNWRNRRYVSVLVNAIAGAQTHELAQSRQQEAIAAAPTESIKKHLQTALEAFELRSVFPLR